MRSRTKMLLQIILIAVVVAGANCVTATRSLPSGPWTSLSIWDWTNPSHWSGAVVSPWLGATAGGSNPPGYSCPKSDGWELYARRLYPGDEGIYASTDPSLTGALYFALYNKFTGILRVFSYRASGCDDYKKYLGSVTIQDDQKNIVTGNHFNQGSEDDLGHSRTMNDAPREGKRVFSSADASIGPWQSFDFQMNYEPTTMSRRYLNFNIDGLYDQNISLSGNLWGDIITPGSSPNSSWSGFMDNLISSSASQGVKYVSGEANSWGSASAFKICGSISKGRSALCDAGLMTGMVSLLIGEAIAPGLGSLIAAAGITGSSTPTYSVSKLDAKITLNGVIETQKSLAGLGFRIGLTNNQFESYSQTQGALDVPYYVSSRTTKGLPVPPLGILNVLSKPKVYAQCEWVPSNYFALSYRGYSVGSSDLINIDQYSKHVFRVEDMVSAGKIIVNPHSGYQIKRVTYAIQENTWLSANYGNMYQGGSLYNMQLMTSKFSPGGANDIIIDVGGGAAPPINRVSDAGNWISPSNIPTGYDQKALIEVSVLIELFNPTENRDYIAVWTFKDPPFEYVPKYSAFVSPRGRALNSASWGSILAPASISGTRKFVKMVSLED